MKLSDLTSAEQVKAEALKNPAVRASGTARRSPAR